MVPFLISRHNYTDREVSLVLHLRRPQDQSGLSQFAYALVKTNRNSFFSLRDSMSEQKWLMPAPLSKFNSIFFTDVQLLTYL